MHRYELTDEQWDLVEYLFPERTEGRGRPRKSPREVLNALFWILRSGAPWRDLPERYGPWQSVLRSRPLCYAGDKGFSQPRIRSWLKRHSVRCVIPRRSDQHPEDGRHRFDRKLYRMRSAVEQCIGWI